MSALLRILLLVPFAYVAACLAGGAFGAAMIFQNDPPDGAVHVSFAVATGFLIAWGSGLLLVVPAVIGAVVAELAGWRSWMFWVPFWVVLALLLCVPGIGIVSGFLFGVGMLPPEEGLRINEVDRATVAAAAAAAGVVAGFVYWLIAGRLTGTGWNTISSGSGPASPQSRPAPSRTDSLPPASPSASA